MNPTDESVLLGGKQQKFTFFLENKFPKLLNSVVMSYSWPLDDVYTYIYINMKHNHINMRLIYVGVYSLCSGVQDSCER